MIDLLEDNDIPFELRDRRITGTKISIKLDLKLREKQKKALKALLSEDQGLLVASTGFGKTIVAAALIAERKVSTLILVNRVELVRQWQTRLQTLIISGAEVGVWYGTKRKRTEEIDIASIQSVERMDEDELRQFLSSYGMLIVDECHHVASPNYQRVVSCSAAKYRYGLSATPVRKDGKEKIINFLCGPELIRVEENLSAKCTYRVLEFDGLFYPFTEKTTYRYKNLRLIAAFDNLFYNDSAVKTDAGVAAGKNLKDQRTYNIGGTYDFGDVRMYLGYQFGQNIKTPRQGDADAIAAAKYDAKDSKAAEGYDTNAVTLGTKIKLFGGELNGTLGYAHAKRDYQDSKADVYQAMLGYKYPLSKRTYAYGAVGYIHGKSQNKSLNKKKVLTHNVERVNTRSFFMGLCHEF